jgi:hypothetical protein
MVKLQRADVMSLKWWEKTVEYQFVLEVASLERLFLAPLDGAQEAAGDSMFSADNRWVLIEFKKDYQSIVSEQKKFDTYKFAQAQAELGKNDRHHLIVYGSSDRYQSNPKLTLNAQTYFSGLLVRGGTPTVISCGTDLDYFKTYVKRLVEFKKVVSGGGLEYSMVAGVATSGAIVECISLSEFAKQIEPGLVNEQSPARGIEGPGR